MLKNAIKGKVKINLGIELLRAILCLWVLFLHCSDIKKEHKKYFNRSFHVPTFFMISFYFYYKLLNASDSLKIKRRFQRLLYPYILWPVLAFLLNNILIRFSSLGKRRKKLTLIDLYLQILTGSRYYRAFWFLFNLLFLSILFTVFAFIFKKNFLISYEFFGIISLFLLFTKINRDIFFQYEKIITLSIGRVNSSIPLSVIGCIYSSINLLSKIKNLKWHVSLILISLIYILFNYDLFIKYPGFCYSNSLLFLSSSTFLFILFGSLKLDYFILLNKIIKIATKYTGGIYYIHPIFPKFIYFYLNIKKASYFSSFFIYIISYLICFFGNKLFTNSNLKYLFV